MMRHRGSVQLVHGLVTLTLWWSFASIAQAAEPAGVETQASILFAHGDVVVRPDGGEWQPARTGQMLSAGAEVRVGPQAYVELAYDRAHATVSRLDQEGVVKITEAGPDGIRLELRRGRLFNLVAPLASGQHFVVQTPEAVASVRGTAFEGVRTDHTEIKVFDLGDAEPHQVAVQAIDAAGRAVGEERLLDEGEKAATEAGRVREAESLSSEEQQGGQERLQAVEQHAEDAAPREGAQQIPLGGPPPGAPPAGLVEAPASAPNVSTLSMDAVPPREAPGVPPMDEAHIQAMADVLGVAPEHFKEMSPRDVSERMEGAAMDRMRTAQEWTPGQDVDARVMEHPERFEPPRDAFKDIHERAMEQPELRDRSIELRQESRDLNQLPPPPKEPPPPPMTGGNPPPPSGDQPPNSPPKH